MIKLIATDLDGTLLTASKEISTENVNALLRLIEAGVKVVPVTGRVRDELPPELLSVYNPEYVITSSGAVCTTGDGNEVIYEALIPGEDVLKIKRIISGMDCGVNFHSNGKSYTFMGADKLDVCQYYRINEDFREHFRRYSIFVDNILELLDENTPVEFILLYFHDPKQSERCLGMLREMGMDVASSDGVNMEVTARGATKGRAISALCKRLGVSPEELITVGDSENDLTMMKCTPNSCAVSNAVPALKEAASRVICSNEEHILDYLLKNIIDREESV